MKNKGFIQTFTVLLILACIYQLSFTFKTRGVEKDAQEWAAATGQDANKYLDSIGPMPIYNFLGIKYTYLECKDKEISLGLDLKGGMNVTMEVSVPDIVKSLANNTKDPKFNQAIDNAVSKFNGEQDFIELFKAEWDKVAPGKNLAPLFTNKDLKEELPYDSPNDKVYSWLVEQSKQAVSRAYQIINQRIDQFGVVQPNVQELGNGRILVELPGVKDPKRVRNILQSSAKLEFWNTYANYDSYKFLEAANTVVKNKLALEEAEKEDKGDSTTKGTTLTATEDTGIDSTKKDSAANTLSALNQSGKADSTKTPEQLKKENPILSLIIPNTVEDPETKQQRWADGAGIGFVPTREMETLQAYFDLPEVKKILPPNLLLRWSFKPTDENRAFFMLYGIKAGRDGLPALPGDVVTSARKSVNPNGEIGVSMSMSPEGASDWRRITAQAAPTHDAIAIMLDDKIYSAPTVNNEISNGMSEISGGFNDREADDLANILKAGKLPAPTRIVEESVVGPTLGETARKAGILSLILGFLAVIIFVILYYGRGGMYAILALLLNLFFLVAIMAGYGAALTLPGLAGLVLTMGMAIDTNVLINERIKEELAHGKNYSNAVSIGYKQAFSAIIDSNITTLIGGLIMAYFGSGPVKGFAVVLIIGIFTSLFTGILISRIINEFDMRRGREVTFTTSLSKNLFKNANYNLVGKRKTFYIISSIFIFIGVISMVSRGFSTGVDFKGGWTYTIQFDGDLNSNEIREEINKVITENVEVKTYGTDNQFRITTAYKIDDQNPEVSEEVEATLLKSLSKFNVKKEDILSSSKIGPTIAADVRQESSIAVILAVIGIFFYIVIRFRKVSYGMGGAIALIHDVLAVLTLYTLFWGILPFPMDIDQAFIGAILTVLGYSINDTVVVFDRIREFLGINKFDDQKEVVNNAINQTLSRTVITATSSIITLLVLFLFGGEGLKGFTFALLTGIIIGTYSSIFVASPVVIDLDKKKNKK
ncbi:MAG: protein translocase subunit SecDF [Flavobacteriales bacterium]|nr:protein translocase subunit SecDF [Flavobacteriales bacterium]